jgi:hypothetical protein
MPQPEKQKRVRQQQHPEKPKRSSISIKATNRQQHQLLNVTDRHAAP